MNLTDLIRWHHRDAAIREGAKIPWDDEDFSHRMLANHLALERDVLAQPGVRSVVVVLGINDIAWPGTACAREAPRPTLEALTAGYLSSTYKEAAAFVVILLVLFFMPQGLFGRKTTERV